MKAKKDLLTGVVKDRTEMRRRNQETRFSYIALHDCSTWSESLRHQILSSFDVCRRS